MSRFTFLHAADIHLDSPMLNLENYDGAPVEAFRGATRAAFDNLVRLAIEEKVRFVLIAGDLFDGECRDFNTPLYLRRKLSELGERGIRTFIILGNHDAQSHMDKGLALSMPEGAKILRADAPETVELEDVPVAIHGQSFASRRVTEDLSAGYPQKAGGRLNIGLLHTNCGAAPGHDPYAPTTVEKLQARGYEYWALGHVHARAELRGGHPWIVYPGNTQGRSIREQGARGCTLVRVDGTSVAEVTHRDLDVCRWTEATVDAGACEEAADVVDLAKSCLAEALEAAGGRSLAARVTVTGSTAHTTELTGNASHWADRIRLMATDTYCGDVWVEKVRIRTTPPQKQSTGGVEVDAGLAAELAALEVRPEDLANALTEIRGLLERIPTDLRVERADIDVEDPKRLKALVEEAKQVLVARLHGEAGGA